MKTVKISLTKLEQLSGGRVRVSLEMPADEVPRALVRLSSGTLDEMKTAVKKSLERRRETGVRRG